MPNEKAEYRLTPKAREDMETVWLFSIDKWGPLRTEHYIDELTIAFAFLASNPKAGIVCDHISIGYRKYPIIRHVVYYRATDYGIEVIRVLHDRMSDSLHF